ncbi:MAG: Cys-tRNA(Pro) deacylase [Atopobiaceae bacterium]|nr:Cys-tRNA(Pro) deacylase [Atopobiaceae bacterium]
MSRRSKARVSKTNAMRELDRAGIAYVTRTYEHGDDDGSTLGVHIAQQLGQDPASAFKTLVCAAPDGDHVVCCVPVAAELDLKRAAAASGHKSLSMVHVADLEALTGYVRGGCSPIGMRKRFATLIDESATEHDIVSVSGGARGISLELAPDDLAAHCGATFAPITHD